MNFKDVQHFLELLKPESEEEVQIITPFIEGPPGIGKSSVVAQFCIDNGYDEIIDLRMSQHDSTDIKGIPRTYDNFLKWVKPEFMPIEGNDLFKNKKVILFFDELNRANWETIQSIFEIVYDRKIGGVPLLKNTFIVSAGNLGADDGTDVVEFDPALKDRFVFIKYDKPEDKHWIEHEQSINGNEYVIGFIRDNPQYLFEISKETSNILTPRRWSKFSAQLNKIYKKHSGCEQDIVNSVKLITPSYLYWAGSKFLDYYDKKLSEKKTVTALSLLKKFGKKEKEIIKNLEEHEIYSYINDEFPGLVNTIEWNETYYKNLVEFSRSLDIEMIIIFHKNLFGVNSEWYENWVTKYYPEVMEDFEPDGDNHDVALKGEYALRFFRSMN